MTGFHFDPDCSHLLLHLFSGGLPQKCVVSEYPIADKINTTDERGKNLIIVFDPQIQFSVQVVFHDNKDPVKFFLAVCKDTDVIHVPVIVLDVDNFLHEMVKV